VLAGEPAAVVPATWHGRWSGTLRSYCGSTAVGFVLILGSAKVL